MALPEIEAGTLRQDQLLQRIAVPAFDIEFRAGEQHGRQHRAADSRRRVACKMPAADVSHERLALDGLVAAQVFKCEHAVAIAAMLRDGLCDFTFVEDARSFARDHIEGIGEMRDNYGIPGVEQGTIVTVQRRVPVCAAIEDEIA